jgi:hypothetical protein
MAYQKKIKPVYTKEDFIGIMKQCETKGEFTNKYPKLYRLLLQKDYGKELINTLPRKVKWTDDELIDEARKYATKAEWMKNNISSYNTALKNKDIFIKCVQHMDNKVLFGKVVYTYDYCKEVYSKYDSINDILTKEKSAYNAAIRNNWHKELSVGKLKYKSNRSKWTFEKVRNEALKYNSIKDFATGNRAAYFKAVYSKWLLQVIDHMDGGYTKWTLDKIVDVLKNHQPSNWYKIKECKAPLAYIKRHNLQNELEEKLKDVK